MTISSYSLAVRLTGTQQPWTTVHSSGTLADVETEAKRYADAGHDRQQIRVTNADGSVRHLGEQVALYVEFLVFAHQRGSLVEPGKTVRTLVRKDARMCQRISDAFDQILSQSAAGRQCLAPTGDLSRQFNSITEDGPTPRA